MDIRTVETLVTNGALATQGVALDPSVEVISLVYDNADASLTLVDENINYNYAQFANESDTWYKKVFLTYNGGGCSTNQVLETVVMESNPAFDPFQRPGYANSNEWEFHPREWSLPVGLREMTDPNDYTTYPYDVREGFTVVKQFLTGQGNISPGDPAYTAFYRAPHLISFLPANVEGNRVYTDGWYTSYLAVVPSYENYQDTIAQGQIFYSTTQSEFYINLTGETLIVDINNPDAHLPWNDTTNWQAAPNFVQWKDFMRDHIGAGLPNEKIYFVESQHLVTADLVIAIRKELFNACGCCDDKDFGASKIATYMRLTQKRMGAFVKFNDELYHEAQCIIESARKLCHLCLFSHHKNCKSC